jgi:hypothetical protein
LDFRILILDWRYRFALSINKIDRSTQKLTTGRIP